MDKIDHRRQALYKELAMLESESLQGQTAEAVGYGRGGCFPSAGSIGAARTCDKPEPPQQGEVSLLADTIYARTEDLHREISGLEQRFASVLRPPDPQNKTGPSAPVMTTLGGRLYDVLQCLDTAISRVRTIQELACL